MADLDAIHTNNRFSSHNVSSESTAGDSMLLLLLLSYESYQNNWWIL